MGKRNWFRILLILFAVLLVAAGGAAFYNWRTGSAHGEVAWSGEVVFSPASPLELGAIVHGEIELAVPWGQTLESAVIQVPSGAVLMGKATWKTIAWHGRTRQMKVEFALRPYHTGTLKDGSLAVEISRPDFADGSRKLTLTRALPEIEVIPREVAKDAALPLAGTLDELTTWSRGAILSLIAVVIVFLLLIWGAVSLWRRHHTKAAQKILPPWERARQELATLRQNAVSGERPLPWCFAKLSDVVRLYLSERFRWKIQQQTTDEFFSALRRERCPELNPDQKKNLVDFMLVTELVKFAGAIPNTDDFDEAAMRAETLVKSTQPAEPENAAPNSGKKEANA